MIPLHIGFYTPARLICVFGGFQYEYQNNSDEARWNLWNFQMWRHILEDI
jgi:hypothetical protein